MSEKRSCPTRCATLSGLPVMKLSMQMTSWPSAMNRSQRCEPRKPAPPVMRVRGIRSVDSVQRTDNSKRQRGAEGVVLLPARYRLGLAVLRDGGALRRDVRATDGVILEAR